MSTITNSYQIGMSSTPSQNFTLTTPSTPDGTLQLYRGNVGTPLSTPLSIDANNNVSIGGNGTLSMSTPFSFRNRIINGDMRVQQRSSGVYNSGTGNFYSGPDRYTSQCGVATGQFTQSAQTMTIGGTAYASLRQTVNTVNTNFATTNYWQGVQQPIEGYNCYDLVNKPFTISFWFNSNLSGTYNCSVRDNNVTHAYVTTFSYTTANTPQYVTVSIPAYASMVSPNSSATGLYVAVAGLNNGTYATATMNAWQSGNYFVNGSATNWAATVGNFIEVTMLQLEAGSIATPFEFLRYSDQLLFCQRYLQTWGTSGNVFMGTGPAYATTAAYVSINCSCPFRISPTMSASGTINVYGGGANYAVTTFGYMYWGANSPNIGITINVGSGLVTGGCYSIYTSGQTVYASAEL
jgi:hypothetical protein